MCFYPLCYTLIYSYKNVISFSVWCSPLQNTPKNVQSYKKKLEYERKTQKNAFFFKNIWSYKKKAVPLHPLSRRKHAGCSSARLECLLWEQEVVSSNLAIPTKPLEQSSGFSFVILLICSIYRKFIINATKSHV